LEGLYDGTITYSKCPGGAALECLGDEIKKTDKLKGARVNVFFYPKYDYDMECPSGGPE
jgi:hypothetical protein